MMTERHPARFQPLMRGRAIRDQVTGLVWERRPAATMHTWAQVVAGTAGGWRLPSIGELMHLLTALPGPHVFEPGAVFWSASESPYAPAAYVRAVVYEGEERFTTLLLEKSGRARPWRVRAGD